MHATITFYRFLGLLKELKRKLEEKERIVLKTSARHTSEECEQQSGYRYCSQSEFNELVICNKKRNSEAVQISALQKMYILNSI